MKETCNLQMLREWCFKKNVFPQRLLNWIAHENLWNIWVPKKYGGLELSFSEGLVKLQELAKIDGSLGWTVTLCSGANYFIGNLEPKAAAQIFENPQQTVLGGSGGTFGTAEKMGEAYQIEGTWHYATGAPYLSHFTLNAKIIEDGKMRRKEDGSPEIRSFVLPKEKVSIIENWNTIGLKASATHSFKVRKAMVHKRFSFLYNEFYLSQAVFKIPFSLFADLTLWVNYVGMGQHFLEEARRTKSLKAYKNLEKSIGSSDESILSCAKTVESKLAANQNIPANYRTEIHNAASHAVKDISQAIIALYPFLGVRASREDRAIHQIFCDYFTATQHHIFTK